MERNIFCSLFKYKPNNYVTPEENFVTESFVYLLYLSLQTDRKLLQNFFGLLDSKILLKETDDINIETQRTFDTDIDKIAIPDITITVNKNIYFIEVKVSSELNTYEVLNNEIVESINQIQKYSQIKAVGFTKHIYTLTVYNLKLTQNYTDFKKALLWNDVYYLLDGLNSNDTFFNRLVSEFKIFLTENNMVINRVSENLIVGIKELTSFNFQLDFALKELDYSAKPSNSGAYCGYYLNIVPPGIRLWIGIGFNNPTLVKIQITNKALINFVKDSVDRKYDFDPDSKRYIIVSSIDFIKDRFFTLSANEQKDKIKDWLKTEISKLITFIGQPEKSFNLDE